jgi:hypothetical protein
MGIKSDGFSEKQIVKEVLDKTMVKIYFIKMKER